MSTTRLQIIALLTKESIHTGFAHLTRDDVIVVFMAILKVKNMNNISVLNSFIISFKNSVFSEPDQCLTEKKGNK